MAATFLSFGTGGMRGIMGEEPHQINGATIRTATQGLANYLLTQPAPHSLFIGYDSRHQSRAFAEEAAKVLAANGLLVYLFDDLRPTPLVSFGCRLKKCSAAIMITASHNPPEYNGYKVYWSDGAQILPPHDQKILAEVNKLTQIKQTDTLQHPLIQLVGAEIDQAYLAAIRPLQLYPKQNRQAGPQLKIVYTSLHGTGIKTVPKALQDWGFSNLQFVEEQIIPDGDFPTVTSPNPEESAALKLGIEKMAKTEADLIIATDPDCDRVGVAVRHQNRVEILTGNQLAAILLEHILAAKQLPSNAAFIKTIGTTELFQAICDAYHKPCYNVLTGFKYIAEKIHQWEQQPNSPQFIFGGEESFGYLLGTQTRDKDAVIASALICEASLQAKLRGETLVDALHKLYHKFGFYLEKLLTLPLEQDKEPLENLRKSPPKAFCDIPVDSLEDYQHSLKYHLSSGKSEPLTLPKSPVLLFWLRDGSKLMVRPSGTEPKVKIYCGVVQKEFQDLETARQICDKRAESLIHSLEHYLKKTR